MNKITALCDAKDMTTQTWKQYAVTEIFSRFKVRLIEPKEKAEWDNLIIQPHHRDFYQKDGRPKDLWLRALHPKARRWLKSQKMPDRFARYEDPGQYRPLTVKQCRSLWKKLNELTDGRRTKG